MTMKTKMRTFKVAAMMLVAASMSWTITSCSDNNDDNKKETEDPEVTYTGNVAYSKGILFQEGTQLGTGDQEFVFTGDATLKKGTYLLKGWVYVADGAKLTIPAGTIIKGDKETKAALIVEPGGQVFAEGTKEAPIVFTSEQPVGSRKPGDWGGLIICGKAPNNQGVLKQQIEGGPRTKHGGTDEKDNSGVFRYIRVEFAGYPFDKDKEINGITFGSVGNGTKVDHLQVSYSNDDSYEWFGGTVNCKYLVAYKGWDDEFDTDNGFNGHVQYCLSIRDPRIADTSQSNGFESDNCADGSEISPYTSAIFSNVTFIGPMTTKNLAAGFENKDSYINASPVFPNNGAKLGLFQAAMQIRRSSKLNCYNTLAVGYPIGLIIDGEKGATVDYAKAGNQFFLKNIIFAGMGIIGSDNNKYYKDELYNKATATYDATQKSYSNTFFFKEGSNNKEMTESALNLSDPKSTGQNYAPASVLTGGNFSDVTSSFLDKTATYIGAFKDANDNWLDGWTNFDPQNTAY